MRQIPGVPLIYLHGNAPTLERPSAMTESLTERIADGKTELSQHQRQIIAALKEQTFGPTEEKDKKKKKQVKRMNGGDEETVILSSIDKASMHDVRIVQRNLVYVIGLAPFLANEEVLRRYEYFGQYGKIVKVVINRANMDTNGPNASASAYITFDSRADALDCILAMDGFYLEERMLRASFGTTKYCNYFLRGAECGNPDCQFLHYVGEEQDCFTLEQMQNNKKYFRDYTHPGPGPRLAFAVEGPTKLPPPPTRAKAEPVARIVPFPSVTVAQPVVDVTIPKRWGAPGTGVAILKNISSTVNETTPKEANVQPGPIINEESKVANDVIMKVTTASPPPGIDFCDSLATMHPSSAALTATVRTSPNTHPVSNDRSSIVADDDVQYRDDNESNADLSWVSSEFEDSKIDFLFKCLPPPHNFREEQKNFEDPVSHLASMLGIRIASITYSNRTESRYQFANPRLHNPSRKSPSRAGGTYIWSSPSAIEPISGSVANTTGVSLPQQPTIDEETPVKKGRRVDKGYSNSTAKKGAGNNTTAAERRIVHNKHKKVE